jgi:hypothetical protein
MRVTLLEDLPLQEVSVKIDALRAEAPQPFRDLDRHSSTPVTSSRPSDTPALLVAA